MLNLPRWRLRVFFFFSIYKYDQSYAMTLSWNAENPITVSKLLNDLLKSESITDDSTVTAPCICFLGIKTSTKSPRRNSCKFISRSFIFELQDHVEVTVVLSVMISFLSVFSVKLHQDAVGTLATLHWKSLFTGGKIHSLNQVKCSFSPFLVLCIYVYTFFLARGKLLRKT